MKEIIARLEKLVIGLASQQHVADDWWRAELASIKEGLADWCYERGDMEAAIAALPLGMRERVADTRSDREFERRVMEDRRMPVVESKGCAASDR